MTRLQRFRELTSTLDAPSIFLDAAWLFSISAALERRVYFGDANRPLHANQYILLVGPAGVGKGLALRESKRLLSNFPLFAPEDINKPPAERTPIRDTTTNAIKELYHRLPDATTFENLAFELSDGRKVALVEENKKITTCAAYFLLEELSSLIKPRKSEDVARFLLNMYDGEPYTYKTRTSGTATIENGCLNMMAGTTPDYLRAAEESNLIGEGLMSRFLIVAIDKSDRPAQFFLPDLTVEQVEHQNYLRRWLNYLGYIYGRIQCDTGGTIRKLEDWWKDEAERLAAYHDVRIETAFRRRKVQVIKLAIAFHFSEVVDKNDMLTLPFAAFEKAIQFIHLLERSAVDLINNVGRSKTYNTQTQFMTWLERRSPATLQDVHNRLSPHLDMSEMATFLLTLEQHKLIARVEDMIWLMRDGQLFRAGERQAVAAGTPTIAV